MKQLKIAGGAFLSFIFLACLVSTVHAACDYVGVLAGDVFTYNGRIQETNGTIFSGITEVRVLHVYEGVTECIVEYNVSGFRATYLGTGLLGVSNQTIGNSENLHVGYFFNNKNAVNKTHDSYSGPGDFSYSTYNANGVLVNLTIASTSAVSYSYVLVTTSIPGYEPWLVMFFALLGAVVFGIKATRDRARRHHQ